MRPRQASPVPWPGCARSSAARQLCQAVKTTGYALRFAQLVEERKALGVQCRRPFIVTFA
jgi:hypothetical protein